MLIDQLEHKLNKTRAAMYLWYNPALYGNPSLITLSLGEKQQVKSAGLTKLERVRIFLSSIPNIIHHCSPFTSHHSPFISILSQLASSQPAARMPATFKSSSFGSLSPAKIW
jgi:hypothetical protein